MNQPQQLTDEQLAGAMRGLMAAARGKAAAGGGENDPGHTAVVILTLLQIGGMTNAELGALASVAPKIYESRTLRRIIR